MNTTVYVPGDGIKRRFKAIQEALPPAPGGPFQIRSLEACEQDLTRSGAYEIIWTKSASGCMTVDHQDYCVASNTIYCVSPGQWRAMQFNHNPEGYYLQCSTEFVYMAEAELNTNFLSMRPVLQDNLLMVPVDDEMQQAEAFLLKIRKEAEREGVMQPELLQALFRIFMLYLSRAIVEQTREEATPTGRDTEMVRQFMQLLRRDFTRKKLVADYAADLCVTPQYLSRLVKKVSGLTVSQHIQQSIILEAKRQAAHSNNSMKEIAFRLGFNDTAHFSKFFKNCTGMNFSTYKQTMV